MIRSTSVLFAHAVSACAVFALCFATFAQAADKVVVTTPWFAQADFGGPYQALATGIYKKHGLDVTLKSGGPQVNSMQLLLANQTDFIMNYDFAVLQGIEKGFPLVTVAAPYQFDVQCILTRDDVPNLAALKSKTILVAGTGMTYWWPWFKGKYGYDDSQVRPYTSNLQPFFSDKNVVQQAFATSEPYATAQAGVKTRCFMLSDEGYPPYTLAITTTRKMVAERPDVVARFVRATLEGWKDFLDNPAPASALIKKDNPEMTDGKIQFAVQQIKQLGVVTSGDATRLGIGTMSDERWKKTADFMVAAGLLKPDTDWRKAYTTQFVKDLRIMP